MQCQPGKCLKDQLFCVYVRSALLYAMQRTTVQWDEKYELCVTALQKVLKYFSSFAAVKLARTK